MLIKYMVRISYIIKERYYGLIYIYINGKDYNFSK